MDTVILKCPDHLKASPITHVCEPRVLMSTEVTLENFSVGRPIKKGTPLLQFSGTLGGLLRVQLGHAPTAEVLAASHCIRKVRRPSISLVNVGQRCRHPSFGHNGVGLSKQRLADKTNIDTSRSSFDGGSQPCATRADDENIVLDFLVN